MDIGYIAIVLGVILVSMTLHEVMHGFVAYWLGDDTARLEGRLTLNPIKHIDPFLTIILPVILAVVGGPIFGGAKPVPFNPNRVRGEEWGVALVGFAGPLTNFLIAFIVFGLWVISGMDVVGLGQVLYIAVVVNLGFFVFNMIPVPPLDGSRVLFALAPDFARRGMIAIEQYSLLFIFALVLVATPVIGAIMRNSVAFFIDIFALFFGVR